MHSVILIMLAVTVVLNTYKVPVHCGVLMFFYVNLLSYVF